MKKLKKTLTSRKFLAYISTVAGILAADTVPGLLEMAPITINAIVAASIGYMTSQAIQDHGEATASHNPKI